MKTLLLLFLPVLASWCSGPKAEDKSAFADNVKTENTIRSDSNSEKAFKKIRLHFKTPGQYYDKIEFWDESSRQLIKIVDLEQLNPFNNLPYKEIGISYGSKKYDLRGVKKNKLSKSIGDWHHTTGHFYKSHDFWGLKFPGRIPETGKIENICESNEPALL